MALSEYVINFNYKQAIAKADELDAAAAKLEADAVAEMDSIISAINQNWTGDNAQAYIQKCTTEQTKITDVATSIRNTAATIRTMAENIRQAEMAALRVVCDEAETVTDAKYWPFPTYSDLLFGVR